MKKKVILLVAIMLVSVMIFAGCESDVSYSRNVKNIDNLKVSMGDDMLYPTIVLDEGKEFFDAFKYKDAVALPEGAKDNEIVLLYIPAVSVTETNKLIEEENKGNVALDDKAYRYSIKVTHKIDVANAKFVSAEATPNEPEKIVGTMEYYIYGTDYANSRIDKNKIKMQSVADRKAEFDKKNAGDKKKLDKAGESAYYVSEIVGDVLRFENKMDSQVIRYFVDGDSHAYELTISIGAGDVNAGVKGLSKEAKAARAKANYDALLDMARVTIDATVAGMRA